MTLELPEEAEVARLRGRAQALGVRPFALFGVMRWRGER
jgi:hypothetical protein